MKPNSSDWNEQERDKQNNEQEFHRTNPKGFKTERQVRLVYAVCSRRALNSGLSSFLILHPGEVATEVRA